MCNAGALYFDPLQGSYGSFPEINAHSFLDEPRNVGMTRDLVITRAGSWVGLLFVFTPPRLGLSPSQQRLLYSAFSGGTDEELSDMLGISLFAVKKSWRAIYDQVAECLPELIPDRSEINGLTPSRGKQKKQRLLAYLREHPEELRPVPRKLMRQRGGK
jgi:hypothetical protein